MGWLKDFFSDPIGTVKDTIDDAIDAVVDLGRAVVDIVAAPFGAGFDAPDVNAAVTEQNILGPLLNKDSGVGPIPIVYGTRRVGGHRVFVSTNGTDNEYLYVAIVLSEGQVDGLSKIYIDDNEVTFSSYAHGVQGTVASGDYKDRVVSQFFDGRDDQTVSTLLDAAPGWDSNHRLRGLAYLALRFRWLKIESNEDSDNNPFRSGIPRINCLLRGKKVFDLTSGYSPTSVGTVSDATGTSTGEMTTSTQGAFINESLTGVTANDQIQEISAPLTMSIDGAVNVTSTLRFDNVAAQGQTSGQINFTIERISDSVTVFSRNRFITRDARLSTDNVSPAEIAINDTVDLPADSYRFSIQIITSISGTQTYSKDSTFALTFVTPAVEDHTTLYANETVTHSNNPVNILVDYLRNPRFGKGLANEYIDWISFRNAALQCDQLVPYNNEDSTTGPFFTCDAVIESSQTLLGNVKQMLQNFRGIMPYQQGRYYLRIEHSGDANAVATALTTPPATLTIDETDIIGGLQIQGESKDRKVNQVRITYTDPDADYQPNDVIWPPEDSATYSTYKAEDNGIELHKAITLPFVTDRELALNHAETYVKTSRNKMSVNFGCTLLAANVAVGDIIRIQNHNLNFDGYYRVLQVQLGLDATLQIGAVEHNGADYELTGHAAAAARPSINLPDPLQVAAPTSLAVTQSTALSGSGYVADEQLDITWTASTDPFVTDYIVQVKPASESEYYTVGITNETEFFWGPVATGDQWDVRVAARNELDRRSDYATVATYTVT